jgi:hypothetical protein
MKNINDGRCVLKTCNLRKVNDSEEEELPCGSEDCYEDINDKIENNEENRCKTRCLYLEHYYGKEDKKCKLKECISRTNNNSEINPCGINKTDDINYYLDESSK